MRVTSMSGWPSTNRLASSMASLYFWGTASLTTSFRRAMAQPGVQDLGGPCRGGSRDVDLPRERLVGAIEVGVESSNGTSSGELHPGRVQVFDSALHVRCSSGGRLTGVVRGWAGRRACRRHGARRRRRILIEATGCRGRGGTPAALTAARAGRAGVDSRAGRRRFEPTCRVAARRVNRARDFGPRLTRGAFTRAAPELVGVTGFEPATSCSQSRRATKLRYTPPPHARSGR